MTKQTTILLLFLFVNFCELRPQANDANHQNLNDQPTTKLKAIKKRLRAEKIHFAQFEQLKDEVELPEIDEDNQGDFKKSFIQEPSGKYVFSFKTPEYERAEKAEIKDNVLTVRGQYIERTVDENNFQIVRQIGYIADENGFRPFLIYTSALKQEEPSPQYNAPTTAPGAPKGKDGIGSGQFAAMIGIGK